MDKTQLTLSQAIEGYFLAAHARRLSPHTLSDYDNTFRKFEAYLAIDPPMARISSAEIRRFLRSQNGLSAKTLLNYHTGLSALWTWAVKEGVCADHVVQQVDRPRPERRDIVPYTKRDVLAILNACDRSQAYLRPGKAKSAHRRPTALRDRAIITLLLDTGMRVSELCALRIRQIDLKNQRVMVMGKGRKERMLPISAPTSQAVWRYLVTRDQPRETAYLFCTRGSGPIDRNTLLQMLKRLGERAGVPGVTVHRFRHTFAITFLRNGGNVYALQRMLGHAELHMVMRYLTIAEADVEHAHREASPVANWLT